MSLNVDRFHAHLDRCEQCRHNPFDLCGEGQHLLIASSCSCDASHDLKVAQARIAALTFQLEQVKRCDCGALLTQCSSCAVADWQAAHPDCPTCCAQQTENDALARRATLPGSARQPAASADPDGSVQSEQDTRRSAYIEKVNKSTREVIDRVRGSERLTAADYAVQITESPDASNTADRSTDAGPRAPDRDLRLRAEQAEATAAAAKIEIDRLVSECKFLGEAVIAAEADTRDYFEMAAKLAALTAAHARTIRELKDWVEASDCCYGGSCIAMIVENKLDAIWAALAPPEGTAHKKTL